MHHVEMRVLETEFERSVETRSTQEHYSNTYPLKGAYSSPKLPTFCSHVTRLPISSSPQPYGICFEAADCGHGGGHDRKTLADLGPPAFSFATMTTQISTRERTPNIYGESTRQLTNDSNWIHDRYDEERRQDRRSRRSPADFERQERAPRSDECVQLVSYILVKGD